MSIYCNIAILVYLIKKWLKSKELRFIGMNCSSKIAGMEYPFRILGQNLKSSKNFKLDDSFREPLFNKANILLFFLSLVILTSSRLHCLCCSWCRQVIPAKAGIHPFLLGFGEDNPGHSSPFPSFLRRRSVIYNLTKRC